MRTQEEKEEGDEKVEEEEDDEEELHERTSVGLGSWEASGGQLRREKEREREDAPSSCRAGLLAHDLNYRTPPPRRERKRDRERRREEGRSVDLALVSGFRSARVRWDGGTRLGEVVSRFGMMEYSAMLVWVGLIAIDGLSKAMSFF